MAAESFQYAWAWILWVRQVWPVIVHQLFFKHLLKSDRAIDIIINLEVMTLMKKPNPPFLIVHIMQRLMKLTMDQRLLIALNNQDYHYVQIINYQIKIHNAESFQNVKEILHMVDIFQELLAIWPHHLLKLTITNIIITTKNILNHSHRLQNINWCKLMVVWHFQPAINGLRQTANQCAPEIWPWDALRKEPQNLQRETDLRASGLTSPARPPSNQESCQEMEPGDQMPQSPEPVNEMW